MEGQERKQDEDGRGLGEGDSQMANLPVRSKRRRGESASEAISISPENSDTESNTGSDTSSENERPRKIRKVLSHVGECGPAFPRSAYGGWIPPLPPAEETVALSDLQEALKEQSSSNGASHEFTYFELKDFSIYRPSHFRHTNELCTLDRLQNRNGFNEFLFDGVLSASGQSRFVKSVPFQILTIDGYGDRKISNINGYICVQSRAAHKCNVWYRLGRPSPEYARFYEPFVWLTQFTKFFVNYLLDVERVTLSHFRRDFYAWLLSLYGDREDFQSWLCKCRNLQDFRTNVAAHVGFLWKEAWSIDDKSTGLCKHPIWGEVDPSRLKAIPQRINREDNTIVTPFAYECFKRMYFRDYLEPRQVTNQELLRVVELRKRKLRLTPYGAFQAPDTAMLTPKSLPDAAIDLQLEVKKGDVVCIPPDTESRWKSSSPVWYAYVQNVRAETLCTALDVIWLYEPADTTIGAANYPFTNELFLSDNCGCGKEAVDLSCVTSTVDVTWRVTDPSSQTGLFVRQKFRTVHEDDTYDFVSIQESDFECQCSKKLRIFDECRQKYEVGDAVLVREYDKILREDRLNPAQIVEFDLERQRVILRGMKRKIDSDSNARPNELYFTEEIYDKPPSHVVRKCHVRVFESSEELLTPYDRDGVGDYYIMLSQHHNTDGYQNLCAAPTECAPGEEKFEIPLNQGWGPTVPVNFEKMKGMGIFCGGGSFDRGLEEGGAVQFCYAVDWAERALHTYRANTKDNNVHFFLGSVNDYIAQAMAGSPAAYIAKPGQFDFLSAGSPCPGFSQLQLDKQSPESLRNASMVASVVSFVDFYCPKYCILENVVSMTHGLGANKDENVFAQIIAAFVGMGYQVQQFHMPAWCFGSSQSRQRIFIVASAPDMQPFPAPAYTHAHPGCIWTRQKNLGRSANGLPFGVCRNDYTPFQHVSPQQATEDLPNIGDSLPQLCPAFPDHRTPSEENAESLARIAVIPTHPREISLEKAARQGLLSGEPRNFYRRLGPVRQRPGSKTYSRLHPNKLFPTVVTRLLIADGVTGPAIHWDQQRTFTVMELKRAQGMLDHEVLIGSPSQQVFIIGNSVERNSALVLGLCLRESWLQSHQNTDNTESYRLLLTEAQAEILSTPEIVDDDLASSRPSTSGGSIVLSQEEVEHIRADPAHGFQTIQQIFDALKNLHGEATSRNTTAEPQSNTTSRARSSTPESSVAETGSPAPVRSNYHELLAASHLDEEGTEQTS